MSVGPNTCALCVVGGGTISGKANGRATRERPRPWPTLSERIDMQDDTKDDGEHEARLRLVAIGRWVEQAEHGDCPVPLALGAISELAAAADRFLVKREAA